MNKVILTEEFAASLADTKLAPYGVETEAEFREPIVGDIVLFGISGVVKVGPTFSPNGNYAILVPKKPDIKHLLKERGWVSGIYAQRQCLRWTGFEWFLGLELNSTKHMFSLHPSKRPDIIPQESLKIMLNYHGEIVC
jgi:hypothetical protein